MGDHQKSLLRAYLATGETGATDWQAWPGQNSMAQMQARRKALRDALVADVRRRTRRLELPPEPGVDWPAYVRDRLTPMVRGLVPAAAQEAALERLVAGVKLVTPATVEEVIREISWPNVAWDVVNLYLDAVGAKPLDGDGWAPLGLAAGEECFVSVHYVTESGPFDDFVVHEAAHMLNDTKFRHVGLPQPRRREWLLGLAFRHRELFAYSCEVWSRVAALGKTGAERRALVEQVAREGPVPNDDTVDLADFLDVLREAASARNGWKRILARCQDRNVTARPPAAEGSR